MELNKFLFFFMQRLTLDVLGQTIFDFDFGSIQGSIQKELEAYNHLTETIFTFKSAVLGGFYYKFLPNSEFITSFEKHFKVYNQLIDELIVKAKKRLNSPGNQKLSMLEYLVQANLAEDDSKMSDEELRSNIVIFFVAGHETTSVALSFIIIMLAKHKDIQNKLRKEIQQVLKDNNGEISNENLLKMEYLQCVIKETMRRYSPVSQVPARRATKDVQLGDYFIPKDTLVGVSIYDIHHDKDVYGDPYNYRPERWTKEEQLKNKIPSTSWIPFSSGSRVCVGNNFSLFEQRVFLVELLTRFEIESLDENEIKFEKVFGISGPTQTKLKFIPLK